ncbi:MAG TPA: Ig-like domain-containing protein, partial [Candidatus Saccharimonadales bacterium]|nr:Ig-like domain-containing protein [Candidatus Saccharimonadales bacterium]
VRCNGTNYTDAGSTRSLKIRNTVERQFCEYVLNDSSPKLSVGCFVRLGNFDATTFGYYDIFAMESDSTEFSVLSFVDGDHGVQLFQEHTSFGVGSMIPIAPNSTYWISMLWDRLAEQATLMVYDPTTWSLLGTSSKDIPNTGPEDNARSIFVGRYDAHLSNGANSTNVIYYDDLLVDATGAQFPLLPQTNAQIASTTLVISVNNTPPHVNITSPVNGSLYSVATQTVVDLTATASDDEQSFAQLSPQWQVILHHNNHIHSSPIDTNWSTTATLAPLGCDGDSYFYRIQLTVSDPAGLSTTSFVDLFPNCVSNAAPTISDIPDQSILQGSGTGPLQFRVGDAETAAGNLSLSGFSSNTGLVPNANIVFGGSGSNRTVTVTPLAGQSGTATIIVLVSDGTSSASDSFGLTVAPPNNTAPTISNISDRSIPEDGTTGAIGFTVNDGQSAAASLGVSGTSSNLGLVPNGNIVFGGSGSARNVTITPLPNQSGSTTITITVTDGLLSTTDTFVLTVTPVNDPPTISGILGQNIAQNSSTGLLPFTVSDLETPAASLTLAGFSSNQGLIPNANIVFGGSGPNRTVTVTPANGQIGSATVTVTVSDGSLSNSSAFLVSVGVTTATYLLAENFEGPGYQDPDWIEHGAPNPDYASLPLEGTQSLRCAGEAYVEHPFDFGNSFYLYFQARWNTWEDFNNIVYWDDDNFDIVAAIYADENRAEVKHGSTGAFGTTPLTSGVTYHFWVEWTKGNGSDGTFKLFVSTTPTKPASPEVNITSGNGGAPVRMYLGPTGSGPDVLFDRLLVDDVPIGSNPGSNQAPTISDLVNQSINEDGSLGPVSFTVGDAESPASNLVVTGSSSDATLVPEANIVFNGSGANRLLTVTPAPNQSGTVTITVTVSDGALTASEAFLLTVVAVNDAPTISGLSDTTVNAGVSTGPLAVTVADVETPVNNLTLTGSSTNPTLVPTANIQFGGSGANRTVTVTPVAGQLGSATITVRVSDGALTGSTSFVLTVNPPPPPTYLLVEGFEGRGLENAGWILHGAPDPDYTVAPLQGAQSLYMAGEDCLERAFAPGNQVSFYFQIRWNAWRDRRNILYWDDARLNLVGELYATNHRLEISHGTSSCMGTNQIRLNTTYHVWVDWVRGTGSNGTMQLFLNTTNAKPSRAEAALTTGNGGLPAHFYLGPMRRGPSVIIDRFLIDDVPIGSHP